MINKRSIIIDGIVTSISLEEIFWEEVDRRAVQQSLPWQEYVRRLLSGIQEVPNRSAAVRETLVRLLREETGQNRQPRFESWWLIKSPSGKREVGIRGCHAVVGRAASNDIVVDDSEVSRKHLLLSFDGECWWATDLESKNGLFLNKKKVQVARMAKGTLVQIGNSELTLVG